MHHQKHVNDSVHWYMGELSARVVAESGRACDRFHLGKLILRGLKDAPDFTLQIDGSSGKSESFKSVLERSVTCAHAMRSLGLKRGDVIVLMAPNHLDLCIPYYAAYYLGVIIAPIDRLLHIKELQDIFIIDEPKIVYCQSDKAEDVRLALDNLKLSAKIVIFDNKCDTVKDSMLFNDLLKKYGSEITVDDFKPSDFDAEDTIAMLVATSGTTGLPKQAAMTHKNFVISSSFIWCRESKFPTPTKMFFVTSPLQWLSAIQNFNMAPILRYTVLMSPQTLTQEHAYHLFNTYKPTFMLCSPTMLTTLTKPGERNKCDFSCLEIISIGGSAVSAELIDVLKEYYKNAEATKDTFSEDGWLKTGDMLYRDEHWNFYFVDKIKLLLKYKNHQISPMEIQNVIRQHPGVLDVAVTGISDEESGDLPVAAVVRTPGHHVTAQEIKDLVKETLSDSKQLRGGVVFLDALPVTASTKVHYRALKKLVLDMERE